MRRHALRLATTLLLGALGARDALADPPPLSEPTRRRAEDAFVVGRVEDLDAILGTGKTAVDVLPLAVRDLLWRPLDPAPVYSSVRDDGSLSYRRIAWLYRHAAERRGGPALRAPYPSPEVGEPDDPYPRLSALVRDRLRRETVGARGLPKESPLARIDDEAIRAFQGWYARRAFEGPRPEDDSPEELAAERARRARFDQVADRNRDLGLGAVGLLALLGLLAVRGAGFVRKEFLPTADLPP